MHNDTLKEQYPHKEIPIITVEGTPYEVGKQIGEETRETIQRIIMKDDPLWQKAKKDILEYIEKTRIALPAVHEEMEGIAIGSNSNIRDVYLYVTEEISDHLEDEDENKGREDGGCTDFAFTKPATKENHTLLGHTNDSDEVLLKDLIAFHRKITGEPEIFTIGIGPWTSVGYNEAGLGIGGNEVWMNDTKVGIPRALLVRAILSEKELQKAVCIAAHPDRASNYNLLLASRNGDIVNIEGSGTQHASYSPQDGRLVHTNHYILPHMTKYEAKNGKRLEESRARFRRAMQLAISESQIDRFAIRRFLSDHETDTINETHTTPICRHGDDPIGAYTIFWNVMDLTEGTIDFGAHPPCRSQTQHFRLPYRTH